MNNLSRASQILVLWSPGTTRSYAMDSLFLIGLTLAGSAIGYGVVRLTRAMGWT